MSTFEYIDPALREIASRYAVKLAGGKIEEAAFVSKQTALLVGEELAGIGHRAIAYCDNTSLRGEMWIVRRWDILFVKQEGKTYVEWT